MRPQPQTHVCAVRKFMSRCLVLLFFVAVLTRLRLPRARCPVGPQLVFSPIVKTLSPSVIRLFIQAL